VYRFSNYYAFQAFSKIHYLHSALHKYFIYKLIVFSFSYVNMMIDPMHNLTSPEAQKWSEYDELLDEMVIQE
jgi:hypothetical protein